MIAIEISQPGPAQVLRAVERPTPKPARGEVLIRVCAAGVARADVLQRLGKYAPPPGASDIPGLDVAGVVDEVGEGVNWPKVGDGVCAILTGGGYAQFCIAPAQQVLPIPDGWNFVEAATLPENMFTVYDNLVTRAGLRRRERVLIHGGTSGIGTTATMLSRGLDAIPLTTVGSQAKVEASLRFGAEHAINYKESDFVSECRTVTAGVGVDVVLDMVGAPYLDRNLDVLAQEGRVVVIATQGGSTGTMDLRKLMSKRARLMGSTMRARSPEQKGEVARRLLNEVWPMLSAKQPIWPVIDSVFALGEAALAHQRLESGEHTGKIVLTP
jgi:NADPH2:quinone reductase